MPHLKITEVVLVQCGTVNNDYQQDLRVFYKFVPNESSCQLLEISPTFVFLKTFNSDFLYIEVWFMDKNSIPLETEDKIHMLLVI